MRKPVAIGGSLLLIIILVVGGFIFSLRACLSQYDERFASPPLLVFSQNSRTVIFTLVHFQKVNSYSRRGNMVNKSVSISYYVQTNDAATGQKIHAVRIKDHSDIKNYPVETLGAANGLAWLFLDEIMALDPFTLGVVADAGIIATRNPALQNKLPAERRYYELTPAGQLYITATDGSKWMLDTKTLLAQEIDDIEQEDPVQAAIHALGKAERAIVDSVAGLYLHSKGQSTASYAARRDELYRRRDTLREQKNSLAKQARAMQATMRKLERLNRRSVSFQDLKINEDTANGRYYGLFTPAEFEKTYDHFGEYRVEYEQSARRKLVSTTMGSNRNTDMFIEKENASWLTSSGFLAGGFLINDKTAMPVKAGNDWLVLYKSKMGNDGTNMLSRVTPDGKQIWSVDTKLPEWYGYFCNDNSVFVLGRNNSELSSNECNVLCIISLKDGSTKLYDYFTDDQK